MSARSGSSWSSRLRPVQTDPLEAMGLISKGDTKLKDFKTQQTYFATVVRRYMEFCASAGRGADSLDRMFASLSLVDTNGQAAAPAAQADGADGPAAPSPPTNAGSKRELGTILMAMRKLREALVASGRVDSFAKEATIFITRAGILTSTYESYSPALQRLLFEIHPKTPLSMSELHEIRGFYILDQTCRRGEYEEAFTLRRHWKYRDDRVEGVLMALVRDDWARFWQLREIVDGYQRALLAWAESSMRKHALKCLGSSYFSVEKSFVEKCAGRSWDDLKAKDQLGWELEGTRVTIRRPRKK